MVARAEERRLVARAVETVATYRASVGSFSWGYRHIS